MVLKVVMRFGGISFLKGGGEKENKISKVKVGERVKMGREDKY